MARQPIEQGWLQRAERNKIGNAAPKVRQRMSGARPPADYQSVGQHGGVHRANTRGADTIKIDTFILKETI